MDQRSIVLGPFVVRTTQEGLVVEAAESRYELDAQHSQELLKFLQHYTGGQRAEHAMPTWVYAMQEISNLPKWPISKTRLKTP